MSLIKCLFGTSTRDTHPLSEASVHAHTVHYSRVQAYILRSRLTQPHSSWDGGERARNQHAVL